MCRRRSAYVAAEDPREEAAHWPVAVVSKGGHDRDAERDEGLAHSYLVDSLRRNS